MFQNCFDFFVIVVILCSNGGQHWAGFDTGPCYLDLHAFGNGKRIFKIDTQISNCTIHLGVPEQQLNGSEVARLLVNLRGGVRLMRTSL